MVRKKDFLYMKNEKPSITTSGIVKPEDPESKITKHQITVESDVIVESEEGGPLETID
jgi:hypothetical protein